MNTRKYQVNREDVQDDDVVGKKETKDLGTCLIGSSTLSRGIGVLMDLNI